MERDVIRTIATQTKENVNPLFEVLEYYLTVASIPWYMHSKQGKQPIESLIQFKENLIKPGHSQDPCSSRPCNRGSCLQILNAPTGYNCLCSGTNYFGDRCEHRKL